MTAVADAPVKLQEDLSRFYADPLGFVKYIFPWGQPGTTLEKFAGPDGWQIEFLRELGRQVEARPFDGVTPVAPIRMARASGHGIGKSTLVAWLVLWIMSTRPHSQGTLTANTFSQLQSKTWAQVQRWHRLAVNSHWFSVTATRMTHRVAPESWFCQAQTCREENSEAFAGQHAATSTSFYIFDEASAIPDSIWEVASGGTTDGAPMWFVFGNPTRSSGEFYSANFGLLRNRWNHGSIDSRESAFTNKDQIQEWLLDHGEDSDYFRVRVRGLPPAASDLQYIDSDRVWAAQRRPAYHEADDPLIVGVDIARGGKANTVFRFRRGLDAAGIPAIRIPGEMCRDSMLVATKLIEIMETVYDGVRPSCAFVDSGFGGPIVDRCHQLGWDNVIEISFGASAPDMHFANMRSWMWSKMRDFLPRGSIDSGAMLETDLTGPGYHHNKQDQIVLEAKEKMEKRGLDSPDDGDALCFVAGTLIQTPYGRVPIEYLRCGDVVTTPFGDAAVAIVHQSGTQALSTARFSNGAVLIGKPEHPIFTFSRGRVRLDALTLTDAVDVFSRWRLALWRLVSLSFIAARNSGFKQVVATFNPGARMYRRDYCIAGCGQTILGLYQRALKSITSMGTGGIRTLATWSCALKARISASTCGASSLILAIANATTNSSNSQGLPPLNGTDPQKVSSGIRSMPRKSGKAADPPVSNVPVAANSTRLFLRERVAQGSALRPARWQLHSSGISRPLGCALGAIRRLWRTATGTRPVVRLCAPTGNAGAREKRYVALNAVLGAANNLYRLLSGHKPIVPLSVTTASVPPTPTFNLTLARHNAYYANGILVFNCLTFAQPVALKPKTDALDRLRRGGSDGPGGPGAWMG